MSAGVFLILLVGAAIHASWNAMIKASGDKLASTVGVATGGAVIAIAFLPFMPLPAAESWPFIAASTVLQMIYYRLVAYCYQVADMSQAYPIMRGSAPFVIAVAGALWMGEHLSPVGWAGIGVLCAAILGMAATGRNSGRRGVFAALATAVMIACYTLVDAAGVRRSGAPVSYTLWLFLTTGLAFTLWQLRRGGPALARALWRSKWPALAGGLGTVLSYGIALWAMTRAPVAMVAALRETSILFGVLISCLILGERLGRTRILAACGIAAGAALIRLA